MSPTLRRATPADLEIHGAHRVATFRAMEMGSGIKTPKQWKHRR